MNTEKPRSEEIRSAVDVINLKTKIVSDELAKLAQEKARISEDCKHEFLGVEAEDSGVLIPGFTMCKYCDLPNHKH